MIRRLLCIVTSVGLTLAFGDVLPTTLNLSTGFNSSGNEITTDLGCDAHWTWGGTNPETDAPCGVAAQVVMNTDPDWYCNTVCAGPAPGQLKNSPLSEWIARDATTRHNGNDTYSVFFYLANDTGAVLNGDWSVEDAGGVYLNGHLINPTGANFSLFPPVSACATGCGAPYLQNGLNTLTILIWESNNSWEGVRFQGTVTGIGASFAGPSDPPASDPPPVPEPSYALVLLLAGLSAVPFALRRRQA